MHRMGRNDTDGARPQDLLDTVNHDFEFAFEGVRDLFVGMRAFPGQDGFPPETPSQ